MKNVFNVYNNEAFVCCVIVAILSSTKKMDIARLFIFVTILLNDKVVNDSDNLLKSSSIKNYVKNNIRKFSLFPDMFDNLIPITLNALTLSAESYYISIQDQEIRLIDESLLEVNSRRLSRIRIVTNHLIDISNDMSTKQLYNMLNVRI